MKADVIVFATGFVGNMKRGVENMFGQEVANKLEDFWGVDDEGELKGAFKPNQRMLSLDDTRTCWLQM